MFIYITSSVLMLFSFSKRWCDIFVWLYSYFLIKSTTKIDVTRACTHTSNQCVYGTTKASYSFLVYFLIIFLVFFLLCVRNLCKSVYLQLSLWINRAAVEFTRLQFEKEKHHSSLITQEAKRFQVFHFSFLLATSSEATISFVRMRLCTCNSQLSLALVNIWS